MRSGASRETLEPGRRQRVKPRLTACTASLSSLSDSRRSRPSSPRLPRAPARGAASGSQRRRHRLRPTSSSLHGRRRDGHACRQRATSNSSCGAATPPCSRSATTSTRRRRSAVPASYGPTWGRLKRDHATRRPATTSTDSPGPRPGYFAYFGGRGRRPPPGLLLYDLGGWHLIALNSNCAEVGGCGPARRRRRGCAPTSPPTRRAARSPTGTTRASSRASTATTPTYERVLARRSTRRRRRRAQRPRPRLRALRAAGRRPACANAGAASASSSSARAARSSAFPVDPAEQSRPLLRAPSGVLELTLGAGTYTWRFLPAVGSFTDSGSAHCH